MADRLLLSSPHMSEEGYELAYIQDAFQKNWIAPLGENVTEFEKAMQLFLGAGYPVALSSGSAALHLSMLLAGVRPGDRVFCQDLTFSASANPVVYAGAEPVFIDSERDSWNMDRGCSGSAGQRVRRTQMRHLRQLRRALFQRQQNHNDLRRRHAHLPKAGGSCARSETGDAGTGAVSVVPA